MAKNYYVIPVFVPHQGCPHDCIFCNQKKISGVKQALNVVQIKNEIDNIISTLDYSKKPRVEIAFFGGSFTGIEKDKQIQYLSIGYEYIKNGLVDALRLSTRPDYIDVEICERLKKYGVEIIELGVQSMDEEVLRESNRGHCVYDVVKACKLIKSMGFKLGIQLMPGLPCDTFLKFKNTVDKAIELKPDIIRLYPTLVIKDTQLEMDFISGKYKSIEFEDAISSCVYGLQKCIENDIEVIRIGLQATDTLYDDIVAGPFHPSFRQYVEAKLFLGLLIEKLEKLKNCKNIDYSGKQLVIYCNEYKISSVSGLNRINKNTIIDKYGFKKIKIIGSIDFEPYMIDIEVF